MKELIKASDKTVRTLCFQKSDKNNSMIAFTTGAGYLQRQVIAIANESLHVKEGIYYKCELITMKTGTGYIVIKATPIFMEFKTEIEYEQKYGIIRPKAVSVDVTVNDELYNSYTHNFRTYRNDFSDIKNDICRINFDRMNANRIEVLNNIEIALSDAYAEYCDAGKSLLVSLKYEPFYEVVNEIKRPFKVVCAIFVNDEFYWGFDYNFLESGDNVDIITTSLNRIDFKSINSDKDKTIQEIVDTLSEYYFEYVKATKKIAKISARTPNEILKLQ